MANNGTRGERVDLKGSSWLTLRMQTVQFCAPRVVSPARLRAIYVSSSTIPPARRFPNPGSAISRDERDLTRSLRFAANPTAS